MTARPEPRGAAAERFLAHARDVVDTALRADQITVTRAARDRITARILARLIRTIRDQIADEIEAEAAQAHGSECDGLHVAARIARGEERDDGSYDLRADLKHFKEQAAERASTRIARGDQ